MVHKPIAIMILPVIVTAILMLAILAATGNAQESSNTGNAAQGASNNGNTADLAKTILEIHNSERAAVSIPPLVWSDELAAEAKTWAF
ncbi:MAG: CAP domain-containing protein [Candidatus Nitrosopolaris sp.]|jgi:uncharacterized protein YkwD